MDFSQFELVDVPIFAVERLAPGDYRLLFLNAAHVATSGMEPEHCVDRRFADMLPPRVAAQVMAHYDDAFAAEGPHRYREVLRLPTGDRWFDTTLVRAGTDGPDAEILIGTAPDITDSIAGVEAATVEIARQKSELERFLGIAAHDLRTPMNNIMMISDVLARDFVDLGDGKLRLIQFLHEVGTKAHDTIDKIVAYVKSEAPESAPEEIQFHKEADDLMALLDPMGNHVLDAPKMAIRAERMTLHIVLRNLIDNSIKHGGRDAMRMALHVRADGPDHLRFEYSDDGVGLPPGFSLCSSGETSDHRTRFGLATIQRLVKSRGGMMKLREPGAGQGAVFSFTFPGRLDAGADMGAPHLRPCDQPEEGLATAV